MGRAGCSICHDYVDGSCDAVAAPAMSIFVEAL